MLVCRLLALLPTFERIAGVFGSRHSLGPAFMRYVTNLEFHTIPKSLSFMRRLAFRASRFVRSM